LRRVRCSLRNCSTLWSKGRSVPLSFACLRQRSQSCSTGASRKSVLAAESFSNLALLGCTNAPPPKATTLAAPPSSSSKSSRKAECSAFRNAASPESRKISAMVRPSRCWMRSSRSSKSQCSRCPRARPTLVLPAPIKPTRKTALSPGTERSPCSERTRLRELTGERRGRSGLFFCLFFRAFSEVNFTTEAAEHDRR